MPKRTANTSNRTKSLQKRTQRQEEAFLSLDLDALPPRLAVQRIKVFFEESVEIELARLRELDEDSRPVFEQSKNAILNSLDMLLSELRGRASTCGIELPPLPAFDRVPGMFELDRLVERFRAWFDNAARLFQCEDAEERKIRVEDDNIPATTPKRLISRLDLPAIRAAIEDLYRIVEDPTPTNLVVRRVQEWSDNHFHWAGPNGPYKPARNWDTLPKEPQPAWILLGKEWVIFHLGGHYTDECPEIADSQLDLDTKAALLELRQQLLAPMGMQQLGADAGLRVQFCVFVASILDRIDASAISAKTSAELTMMQRRQAQEIRRALDELRKVANGWIFWDARYSATLATLENYKDSQFGTPEVVIAAIGEVSRMESQLRIVLQALIAHRCLPPSLRGKSMSEAIGVFPEFPTGALSAAKIQAFAKDLNASLSPLWELSHEIDDMLKQMELAPLSVIQGPWSDENRPARQQTGDEGTPPADPFADLRQFARAHLKGQERAAVEALCDAGGELPIADLAVKDGVDWGDAKKGYDNLCARVNPKLKSIGWKLFRFENARLERIPKSPSKDPSNKG